MHKAEQVKKQIGGSVDAAKANANGLKIDGEREASKLGLTVKRTAQAEARKDGWQSDAFDL